MTEQDYRRGEDFDIVQIAMVDMNGILRGEMLSRTAYKRAERKGIEIACATPFGINVEFPMQVDEVMASNFGNDVFLPETETLVELPWFRKPGRRVGQVLGTLVKENGQLESFCPRNRTKSQLNVLKSLGYTFHSSFACQFTVYKADTDMNGVLGGTAKTNLSAYGFLGAETELLDLARDLKTAGVDVESLSHGDGPGRFELQTAVAEGIEIANMVVRLKFAVKSVLAKRGYSATFMSQPHAPKDTSNSIGKFKFTLRGFDGQNVFTGQGKEGISDLCRLWIAGFLAHGAALTAMFCPTFNCYRKFEKDVTTPRKLDWDIENSSSCLNVKGTSSKDVWLETSLPSSACNPYFLIIGAVAAGIDAMKNELLCPEPSSPDAAEIPNTQSAAVKAMENNVVMKEALSPSLIKCFVTIKQDNDIKIFSELAEQGAEEKMIALEREWFYIPV